MGFSCPCKNIAYPWNVFHTIFFHTFEFFFNTVQIVFIPLLKNFIHCTNCFITLNLFFHTFEFVFVPCKCFSYLVCERQISHFSFSYPSLPQISRAYTAILSAAAAAALPQQPLSSPSPAPPATTPAPPHAHAHARSPTPSSMSTFCSGNRPRTRPYFRILAVGCALGVAL